ncbi:MAG: hypothetical protein K8W52_23290 [Deltaproteobacteria bacterium]|nr:hypothetical protein [Deltaproteobacteria bacterium]
MDRRGKLAEQPFTYRATKDGKVLVSWGGRVVTTVAGAAAARLIAQLKSADDPATQLLLAKVTGQFKHGTERSGDE